MTRTEKKKGTRTFTAQTFEINRVERSPKGKGISSIGKDREEGNRFFYQGLEVRGGKKKRKI